MVFVKPNTPSVFFMPTNTVFTTGASIVSVNAAEVVPSIVSVSVDVTPATVEVLPASVNMPALLEMVTCPDTLTPAG